MWPGSPSVCRCCVSSYLTTWLTTTSGYLCTAAPALIPLHTLKDLGWACCCCWGTLGSTQPSYRKWLIRLVIKTFMIWYMRVLKHIIHYCFVPDLFFAAAFRVGCRCLCSFCDDWTIKRSGSVACRSNNILSVSTTWGQAYRLWSATCQGCKDWQGLSWRWKPKHWFQRFYLKWERNTYNIYSPM